MDPLALSKANNTKEENILEKKKPRISTWCNTIKLNSP